MTRRDVSCETLECRQLLSTGMQVGESLAAMPIPNFGGLEARWFEMAPSLQSSGGQGQIVSNLEGSGLGQVFEYGPGGASSFSVTGDGASATTGAAVTSTATPTSSVSVNAPYGGGDTVFVGAPSNATTSTSTTGATTPTAITSGSGGAQQQVVTTNLAGSSVVSADGGASATALPGGAPTVTGSGPVQTTSSATGSSAVASTATATPIAVQPGGPNIPYGGGAAVYVSKGAIGATNAGSTTGTLSTNVMYGSGGQQGQVVAVDGNGSATTSASATPLPGLAMTQTGSGPIQIVSSTTGSSTATSPSSATTSASATPLPGLTMTQTGSGPMQVSGSSIFTGPSMIPVSGGLNSASTDGTATFVSNAVDGSMNQVSSIGMLPTGATVGTGNNEVYFVGRGGTGSTPDSMASVSGAMTAQSGAEVVTNGGPMQTVGENQTVTLAPPTGLA